MGEGGRRRQKEEEDDFVLEEDVKGGCEGRSVRWAASSGRRGRAIGERIAQQALPGQSHCFFGNDLWWEPGGGNGGDQR